MNNSEAMMQRITVCYPTGSLAEQVDRWAEGREEYLVEPVFARTAVGIRRSLSGAVLALVDASEDHEQAIDLFSQAVARLGAQRVSVYTEQMHEGLERFVRTQGSWLLLGPLTDKQWEDYFSTLLPEERRPALRRRAA